MRNYLTGKERLLVAALALILPFSFAKAEVREDGKTGQQGWYVGVEGGMPFGFSTFSSFGHDKTRPGWAVGFHFYFPDKPLVFLRVSSTRMDELALWWIPVL